MNYGVARFGKEVIRVIRFEELGSEEISIFSVEYRPDCRNECLITIHSDNENFCAMPVKDLPLLIHALEEIVKEAKK